jgi:hypothetical protein
LRFLFLILCCLVLHVKNSSKSFLFPLYILQAEALCPKAFANSTGRKEVSENTMFPSHSRQANQISDAFLSKYLPLSLSTEEHRGNHFVPSINYTQSRTRKKEWHNVRDAINATLTSNNLPSSSSDAFEQHQSKVQIFEIHAGANPSFHDLVKQGYLSQWKQVAAKNNIPFFTFTFLREPVPWALSAYFMICVEQNNCKPGDQPAYPRTIAELVQLALPNPQCGFLWRGGFPYHYQRSWRVIPTSSRLCNELVWKALLIYMDWVGTLEHYHTTMSLLERIMGLSMPTFVANVAKNESKLGMKDIGNTTRGCRCGGSATYYRGKVHS